jgi:serine/threonine-protein kinase
MRWLNRLFLGSVGVFVVWLSGIVVFLYIWLPLYVRGRPVEVPDFRKMTLRAAKTRALKMGLVVGFVEQRPDAEIPRGDVISHLPSAGLRVKQKRPINFIVSTGPETVRVPDLTGRAIREAEYELSLRSLALGHRVYTYTDLFGVDTIIASSPGSNALVARDSAVNVLVSKGSQPLEYLMPRLVGLPLADAERQVQAYRLQLADIVYEYRSGYEQGAVVAQYPEANASIASRDPVTLTVNQSRPRESGNQRIVTVNHQVGGSAEEDVRIKIVVQDQTGSHEMVNGFVKGGRNISIPRSVVGSATLFIYEGDMDVPVRQERL